MIPGKTLSGGCHCGNLSLSIEVTVDPKSISPRTCDCSFCVKHGASYFSDHLGTLAIEARDPQNLARYQHGSRAADFLVCRTCGVLVAVTYTENQLTYGAANANSIDSVEFGETCISSPQSLSPSDKKMRWKDLWFPKVRTPLVR
jgi:hypothetical protein